MPTTPTGNPVPSESPADLLHNAGLLDSFANSAAGSFTDRLGNSRKTVSGFEADQAAALAAFAAQSGYSAPVAYTSGLAMTVASQTVTYSGDTYAPIASFLPFTTSGAFEASKFRIVVGVSVADLAATSGSSLVGYDGGTVQDVLDSAKPLQSYTALRAYTGRATSVRITAPGIAGFFRRNGSAADNGGTVIVDGSGRSWERVFDGDVSALWFEADKSGAADSTAAIVAALSVGTDVMLPDGGTYKLSPTAVQSIPNRGYQRIYGVGDVTLKIDLAASTDVFSFLGPVALDNLTIDFNNKSCRYAFKWEANAGHIGLSNLRIKNLLDTDSATGSISLWIIPTGNSFSIDGVKFSAMLKRGNGSITDSAGSLNLLYVGGGAGSTRGTIANVSINDVHNIDSVGSVIYEDTAGIYIATDSSDAANSIKINNVQGVNFGKRLIKAHASNVKIDGVTGYSTEGDSLGVVGFLSGQGLGDKYGCSASNCRAIGLMEAAFAGDAINITWSNIIASIQPGNKPGMNTAATGILVLSSGTTIDGYWSDSQRDIGIGGSAVIYNTVIRNVTLLLGNAKAQFSSIYNLSSTNGFDGLLIDGIKCTVESDATNTAGISLADYLNGTTKKGRNLTIRNVFQKSAGPLNSYFVTAKYIEGITIENLKYNNTSGLSHFRLVSVENSSNVNVDDISIEGVNQIGVYLKDCTGRSTVSRVTNPSASVASVYNSNCTEFLAIACDHTKVSGITTATAQTAKSTSGTTATRPTTGLVAGYSQHFDSTLGKPIWWNGSVWKDATGATV